MKTTKSSLTIVPSHDQSAVRIFSERHHPIASGIGKVTASLLPGTYYIEQELAGYCKLDRVHVSGEIPHEQVATGQDFPEDIEIAAPYFIKDISPDHDTVIGAIDRKVHDLRKRKSPTSLIFCKIASHPPPGTSNPRVSIEKVSAGVHRTPSEHFTEYTGSPMAFEPGESGTYEMSINNGGVTETIVTWLGSGWVTLLVTTEKDGSPLGSPLILISRMQDFERNYCWQSRQIHFLQDLVFRHRISPPEQILQECFNKPGLNPIASIIVGYFLYGAERIDELRMLLEGIEPVLRTIPDIAILGCLCGFSPPPESGFSPPIFCRGFHLARKAHLDVPPSTGPSSYFSVEIFFLRYSILTGVQFNGPRRDLAERASQLVARRAALAAGIYEVEGSVRAGSTESLALDLLKSATAFNSERQRVSLAAANQLRIDNIDGDVRLLAAIRRIAQLGGLPANVLKSHLYTLISKLQETTGHGENNCNEESRGSESKRPQSQISPRSAKIDLATRDRRVLEPVQEDGIFGGRGTRKEATAYARLRYSPGNGRIIIAVRSKKTSVRPRVLDYEDYFRTEELQTRILRPFDYANVPRNDVDVNVTVSGGGISGQADAIVLAISRSLVKMQPEIRSFLKEAKLLSVNAKVKERKKPGLRKARKAFQFSKR